MIEKKLEIINKLGLHARAATKLANLALNYECAIKVTYNEREIDAKSIMSLMLLAAAKGSEIIVNANGADEAEAMQSIETLINNRFDEDE